MYVLQLPVTADFMHLGYVMSGASPVRTSAVLCKYMQHSSRWGRSGKEGVQYLLTPVSPNGRQHSLPEDYLSMLRIKALVLIEWGGGYTFSHSTHLHIQCSYMYNETRRNQNLCSFRRRFMGVHSVKSLEWNLLLFLIRNNTIKNPVQ